MKAIIFRGRPCRITQQHRSSTTRKRGRDMIRRDRSSCGLSYISGAGSRGGERRICGEVSFLSKITSSRAALPRKNNALFRRYRSDQVNPMFVFNRDHKRMQKERASQSENAADFDYLRDYAAEQLTDRLQDINRDFPIAIDLGCGGGHVLKHIDTLGGVEHLIHMDMAEAAVSRCVAEARRSGVEDRRESHLIADEEAIPLQPESADLIVSSLSLHWVNDLPGTFAQVYDALKPDGVFLGAMLGGDTLNELRSSFVAAEQERLGGVSQHVSPLAQVSDAGTLLQSAGFTFPCIDTEIVHVGYADAVAVWEHLQGMGDSNATVGRLSQVSRDTLLASAAVYQSSYFVDARDDVDLPSRSDESASALEEDDAGYLPATFQIIYLIGWKPAPDQRRPLLRGSATKHLSDLSEIS